LAYLTSAYLTLATGYPARGEGNKVARHHPLLPEVPMLKLLLLIVLIVLVVVFVVPAVRGRGRGRGGL